MTSLLKKVLERVYGPLPSSTDKDKTTNDTLNMSQTSVDLDMSTLSSDLSPDFLRAGARTCLSRPTRVNSNSTGRTIKPCNDHDFVKPLFEQDQQQGYKITVISKGNIETKESDETLELGNLCDPDNLLTPALTSQAGNECNSEIVSDDLEDILLTQNNDHGEFEGLFNDSDAFMLDLPMTAENDMDNRTVCDNQCADRTESDPGVNNREKLVQDIIEGDVTENRMELDSHISNEEASVHRYNGNYCKTKIEITDENDDSAEKVQEINGSATDLLTADVLSWSKGKQTDLENFNFLSNTM